MFAYTEGIEALEHGNDVKLVVVCNEFEVKIIANFFVSGIHYHKMEIYIKRKKSN